MAKACPTVRFEVERDDEGITVTAYRGWDWAGYIDGYLGRNAPGAIEIAMIETDDSVIPRRCGLGTRLYQRLANEGCKRDFKLRSDTARSDAAEGFWRKQVKKRRARCIPGIGWRFDHANRTIDRDNPWSCKFYEMTTACPRSLRGSR